MRAVLLSLPLVVLASSAFAQARPDSLTTRCATLNQMVRQSGALVIGSGPNIYDRYVSNLAQCSASQTIQPSWIPSSDKPQCFVGYRCRDRGPRGSR